uniref:C2H2-type domain-containing protein n=2 Tax=Chenopodium quinoa TaxID=63459 RepID=A0A803N099_CHEQI
MAIKRSREEIELERTIAMANYLILLSRPQNTVSLEPSTGGRIYECKTCNRQFPSFQALGGHRASHKKPRLLNNEGEQHQSDVRKAKIHECSICGLEFPIGQALGGHMRRHRAALARSQHQLTFKDSPTLSLSLSLNGSSSHDVLELSGVSKSKSSSEDHDQRRVICLDLNLTPLENG